ncbi:MAG: T9SS type A sorting domain-containing protein, partial [Calditrichae bacterium]|nr:T9SS type A sorting domain-containing protein [Calditrichia bacterium]
LNANLKAYAAWWLWASLAGWNPVADIKKFQNTNPNEFKLYQNYPNPFNPITNIQFKVEEKCTVTLNVYTVQGRLVANLVSKEYSPGSYDIPFSGEGLSSGIYFYRIQAGRFTDVKKMIILE